jgi:hypothetical protein
VPRTPLSLNLTSNATSNTHKLLRIKKTPSDARRNGVRRKLVGWRRRSARSARKGSGRSLTDWRRATKTQPE